MGVTPCAASYATSPFSTPWGSVPGTPGRGPSYSGQLHGGAGMVQRSSHTTSAPHADNRFEMLSISDTGGPQHRSSSSGNSNSAAALAPARGGIVWPGALETLQGLHSIDTLGVGAAAEGGTTGFMDLSDAIAAAVGEHTSTGRGAENLTRQRSLSHETRAWAGSPRTVSARTMGAVHTYPHFAGSPHRGGAIHPHIPPPSMGVVLGHAHAVAVPGLPDSSQQPTPPRQLKHTQSMSQVGMGVMGGVSRFSSPPPHMHVTQYPCLANLRADAPTSAEPRTTTGSGCWIGSSRAPAVGMSPQSGNSSTRVSGAGSGSLGMVSPFGASSKALQSVAESMGSFTEQRAQSQDANPTQQLSLSPRPFSAALAGGMWSSNAA